MMNIVYSGQEVSVQYIPVDEIRPNPYQPRRNLERVKLNELADSIKEYGVMQPITVRCINKGYELVTGERRLKASRIAGIEKIPAIVVYISDKDSAIMALIENIQRQNLSYFEEAEGYKNIMQDYGMTQEEVAKKVGKSQSSIANKIRVLRLSNKVKNKIIESELSERHARALLKLNDEEDLQLEIIDKVIIQGLNVKRTEELVENYMEKILKNQPINSENKKKRGIRDIRIFTNTIKQAIETMSNLGVEVNYLVEEKRDFYEIKINIPNANSLSLERV